MSIMINSTLLRSAIIPVLTFILLCGLNPVYALAQEGELRTGASGGGEVLKNAKGTLAHRRKRSTKPKGTKTQPKTTAKSTEEYFTQGNEYFEKGEFEKAVKAYEQAISLNP